MKISAVPGAMRKFSGPARIFDDEDTAIRELGAGKIHAGDVVVLRMMGPFGGPGTVFACSFMAALVGAGLGDQVAVVTDGELSGLNRGITVGQVMPEAARGGPLAVIREGETIRLDIDARRIDVEATDLEKRVHDWKLPERKLKPSWLSIYSEIVQPIENGAVLGRRDSIEAKEAPLGTRFFGKNCGWEMKAMVRIACIGGFLGAGKTTALIEAARTLMARGLKVGVITNDQGSNLVDTALVRSQGLQTEEITGGCFCCRFTEFVKHASRLVEQHRPDIILAEAVGSCTDLAATVYAPLRRFHAADFELAPLSVFVEPDRMREYLDPLVPFEDSVRYLFEKQFAEAELIILSKADLLTPAAVEA